MKEKSVRYQIIPVERERVPRGKSYGARKRAQRVMHQSSETRALGREETRGKEELWWNIKTFLGVTCPYFRFGLYEPYRSSRPANHNKSEQHLNVASIIDMLR